MCIGSYDHNIDPKGRVFIPCKWRDELGEEVVVSPAKVNGEYRILEVRSVENWNEYIQRFKVLRETDNKDIIRIKMAQADSCVVDKQGRILLKDALRKYIGAVQNIKLVGLDDVIEVWDSDKWNEYSFGVDNNQDASIEAMKERGL